MEPEQERAALRGLRRAIQAGRREKFGILEYGIAAAVIVMLIAGFISVAFIIGQNQRIAQTARETKMIAADVRALAADLQAAIAAEPENFEALLARFTAELAKQIAAHDQRTREIIVEEHEHRTVIIYTPAPQPTATVTCDPTPVLGNCKGKGRP